METDRPDKAVSSCVVPMVGGGRIHLKVGGMLVEALLSTGVASTFISHELAVKLKVPVEDAPQGECGFLFTPDGTPLSLNKTTTLALQVEDMIINKVVFVTQNLHNMMVLGWDWLNEMGASLDFGNRLVTFYRAAPADNGTAEDEFEDEGTDEDRETDDDDDNDDDNDDTDVDEFLKEYFRSRHRR